jgi:hypothetical protein
MALFNRKFFETAQTSHESAAMAHLEAAERSEDAAAASDHIKAARTRHNKAAALAKANPDLGYWRSAALTLNERVASWNGHKVSRITKLAKALSKGDVTLIDGESKACFPALFASMDDEGFAPREMLPIDGAGNSSRRNMFGIYAELGMLQAVKEGRRIAGYIVRREDKIVKAVAELFSATI